MKNAISILLILSFFAVSCKDDETIQNSVPVAEEPDAQTIATPKGGILNAAEDGPVRSALGQPSVDLTNFRLSVEGLVSSPISLSWDDITKWPAVHSDTLLMYCVEGWEVIGNYKGILVKDLLKKSEVKNDGTYILFHCADGYSTAHPIAYLEKYHAILAYEVNGKRLPDKNGFPLRLVAFGKFGYKWAKWVTKLEVINETQKGYWEKWGYSDRADVPLERRRFYEGEDAQPLEY